jgi:hypothetical protein
VVFQDAQTLFGGCRMKDGAVPVVQGLFEQRFGVRIG